MIIKKPSIFIIDELINRIINNKNKFSTYEDGNIRYILVYSNKEKCLNVFGIFGYYSKLFYSIKFKDLKKELQEVLKC